jgi:hypothetical protein
MVKLKGRGRQVKALVPAESSKDALRIAILR